MWITKVILFKIRLLWLNIFYKIPTVDFFNVIIKIKT